MAFVQTEYTFRSDEDGGSVEMRKTLEGYALYPSHAFDPLHHRLFRLALALVMLGLGAALLIEPGVMGAPDGILAMMIRGVGLYVAGFGLYWSVLSLRRAPELYVDLRNRALHLVHLNWHGFEARRDTVRFEEVTDLRAVNGVPSSDMRWQGRGWEMGRIELIWQKDRVSRVLTGDMAELELILPRLRRDLGLY